MNNRAASGKPLRSTPSSPPVSARLDGCQRSARPGPRSVTDWRPFPPESPEVSARRSIFCLLVASGWTSAVIGCDQVSQVAQGSTGDPSTGSSGELRESATGAVSANGATSTGSELPARVSATVASTGVDFGSGQPRGTHIYRRHDLNAAVRRAAATTGGSPARWRGAVLRLVARSPPASGTQESAMKLQPRHHQLPQPRASWIAADEQKRCQLTIAGAAPPIARSSALRRLQPWLLQLRPPQARAPCAPAYARLSALIPTTAGAAATSVSCPRRDCVNGMCDHAPIHFTRCAEVMGYHSSASSCLCGSPSELRRLRQRLRHLLRHELRLSVRELYLHLGHHDALRDGRCRSNLLRRDLQQRDVHTIEKRCRALSAATERSTRRRHGRNTPETKNASKAHAPRAENHKQFKDFDGRAMRDSNPRPLASEANALIQTRWS